MKYEDIVVLKRWLPILKEYERTKAKATLRLFKYVKNICEEHHISPKDISRYYHKWIANGRKPESWKKWGKNGKKKNIRSINCFYFSNFNGVLYDGYYLFKNQIQKYSVVKYGYFFFGIFSFYWICPKFVE